VFSLYSFFISSVLLYSAQVKEEKAPKKPRKEAVPATNTATAPTTITTTTTAVAPGIAEIASIGGGASETLSQTASPGLKIVLKPPKAPKNPPTKETAATASAVTTKEEPAVAGGEKVPKKRGPKKKPAVVPLVSAVPSLRVGAVVEGSETASVNNNSVQEESIAL
jgi:hypothetical protein